MTKFTRILCCTLATITVVAQTPNDQAIAEWDTFCAAMLSNNPQERIPRLLKVANQDSSTEKLAISELCLEKLPAGYEEIAIKAAILAWCKNQNPHLVTVIFTWLEKCNNPKLRLAFIAEVLDTGEKSICLSSKVSFIKLIEYKDLSTTDMKVVNEILPRLLEFASDEMPVDFLYDYKLLISLANKRMRKKMVLQNTDEYTKAIKATQKNMNKHSAILKNEKLAQAFFQELLSFPEGREWARDFLHKNFQNIRTQGLAMLAAELGETKILEQLLNSITGMDEMTRLKTKLRAFLAAKKYDEAKKIVLKLDVSMQPTMNLLILVSAEQWKEAAKLLYSMPDKQVNSINLSMMAHVAVMTFDVKLFQRYEAILKTLKKPFTPEIQNTLAYCGALLNLDLEAREKIEAKLCEKNPRYAPFLDSLAWIQYLRGNKADATKNIQKALECLTVTTNPTSILVHAGDIALANGDKEKARIYYQGALQFDFQGEEYTIEAVREKLSKLNSGK